MDTLEQLQAEVSPEEWCTECGEEPQRCACGSESGADSSPALPILTNSSQRAYRRCARLYKHKVVDGVRLRGQKAGPLRLGSAVHAGLEAWWAHGAALSDALAATAGEDVDDYEAAKAEAMLTGYHERWAPEHGIHTVLAVELEFVVPLRNPRTGAASRTYRLAGKVDAVVEIDGEVWLVEHKTSGEDISQGSTYWQRLALDSQVSLYMDAIAEVLGRDVVGCVYDVLGKPGLRPRLATPPDKLKRKKDGTLYAGQREQDETPTEYYARLVEELGARPERYYQRGTVARTRRDSHEAQWDAWQLAKTIRQSELEDRWPRNPDACFQFARACDYWAVCSGQCSPDDPTRFEKTKAHEELSHVTGAR